MADQHRRPGPLRGRKPSSNGEARPFLRTALLLLFASTVLACGSDKVMGYKVVAERPHDPAAYTQGLLWFEGHLYESTGRNGTSSVRRVDFETGEVLAKHDLPYELFGEGLALHGKKLFQLTWKARKVRIYDVETLALVDQKRFETEGWGIASDGTHLIVSDGTDLLSFRDPVTFEEKRRVRVKDEKLKVDQLNELEFIEGEIWANRWKHDTIVRIDPANGKVIGYVDLTGIFDRRSIPDVDAVLNGIAYDPADKRIFVTGKLWPKIFEIELAPRKGS